MQIQLDPEYKKLCHIQSIKPGYLGIPTILICIVLTLLTAGIPLFLYWKWQRFRNFIHLLIFNEYINDSQHVGHYLIVDSYKCNGKSRNTIYRTEIVSSYLEKEQKYQRTNGTNNISESQQICKYIKHRNLRYVIRDNVLYSIKFKFNKSIEDYVSQGLSFEQIKYNNDLYGKSKTFSISFFHILRKMLHQKHLRFVFMMFAIKKIIFGFLSNQTDQSQINERIVSITILAEILLTWLIMIGISIFGAKQHNRVHQKIENQTVYKVKRKGQQIEVKLNELCVGDVVIPQRGQIIYFKGIFVAIINSNGHVPYAIVNEKLYNQKDHAVYKIPIQSNLSQVQQINTINPGSQLLNFSFNKVKSKIQGSTLQGQQSNLNIEPYQFLTKPNLQQNVSVKFYIIKNSMKVIEKRAILITLIRFVALMTNSKSFFISFLYFQIHLQLICSLLGTILISINEKAHEHWLNLLLSNIVLCFPFNMGLFCNLSQIISIIRLKAKGISVVNPMIEEIGIANNLSMELSTFQTLQYKGFIKRQRCNGLPLPDTYENKQNFFESYRRTKEDSIYAFLAWIGVYNRPLFQKESIYKQIFENFGFGEKRNQYDDDADSQPRIINSYHHIISIDWQEMQRFPISQNLAGTVLIKNHQPDKKQKRFFSFSEGEYTSEDSFFHFDQIINERLTDQFKDVMQRLHSQGKKIKYICMKKMIADEDESWPQFTGEQVQRKSEFMGLLVFDQWPNIANMKNLIELDSLHSFGQETSLSIKIFSNRHQNGLIGYDHILRHATIFHSMQSYLRAEQTYLTKTDYQGVIHIGHGILDQGSLLISDISINKMSQSYGQADFLITEPQEILVLFQQGMWALYTNTLSVVCIVLFNFSKIIEQFVLFEGDKVDKLEASPLSANFDKLFILDFGALIIPIFLLNLYQPTKNLVRKDHSNFFRVDLMYQAFISLVGLAVLYTIEFIDHGFQGACQIYENGLKLRHLLQLRTNEHEFLISSNQHSCEGIINFITVSFALLTILIVDRQNTERKARNILVGILNKVYMLLLWTLTIILFHIPLRNVIRASFVMLVLILVVFLTQFMTNKTKLCQNGTNNQNIQNSFQERD